MSYLTVYCVLTFRGQGRGVERAQLTSYGQAGAALAEGSAEATKMRGVLVYSVEVDPHARTAGRVSILARHGQVASGQALPVS